MRRLGSRSKRCEHRCGVVAVLAYVLGVVWFLAHPRASVMTGEWWKCRGMFVDENSLLSNTIDHETGSSSSVLATASSRRSDDGLCEGLSDLPDVPCIARRDHGYEVARVSPPTASVEALVLLVERDDDDHRGDRLRDLVASLADPVETPWLAKTIFVVAPSRPSNGSSSTRDVAASFARAIDGVDYHDNVEHGFPPSFFHHVARNAIVLRVGTEPPDDDDDDDVDVATTRTRVLPQGRRGVLPNLDLVSSVLSAFSVAPTIVVGNARRRPPRARVSTLPRDLDRARRRARAFAASYLDGPRRGRGRERLLLDYWTDLVGLVLFVRSLAVDDSPAPHAPFLDRGVDALTIEVGLPSSPLSVDERDVAAAAAYLQTRTVLRQLSSLHERLHHSVTQYWLPNADTFVGHGEYVLPIVLVLSPLLLRAVSLVFFFRDDDDDGAERKTPPRWWWRGREVTTVALGAWCLVSLPVWIAATTTTIAVEADDRRRLVDHLFPALYLAAWSLLVRRLARPANDDDDDDDASVRRRDRDVARSLRSFACVAALYAHVPLLVAHASAALPSALLWSPLLAFPGVSAAPRSVSRRWATRLTWCVVLALAWPPVALRVPPRPLLIRGWYDDPWTTWCRAPLHLVLAVTVARAETTCG